MEKMFLDFQRNPRTWELAAEVVIGGCFVWTFRIEEHADCVELHIYDSARQRRRTCKEKFETNSAAIVAANAFFLEFLAPVY